MIHEDFYCLPTIHRFCDRHSGIFKNKNCYFPVQFIIFCQENSFSFQIILYCFLRLLFSDILTYFKRNDYIYRSSHSFLTVNLDRASHFIQEILYDWHPKTCSHILGSGTCIRLYKWFENILNKFIWHSNPGIFYGKIQFQFGIRYNLLFQITKYRTFALIVLNTVAYEIQ